MPKKASKCRPSGYDVVIRNSNAIKDLNKRIGKAPSKKRDALMDEKERLMEEMWAACPHESVIHDPGREVRPGFTTPPFRICTSCGFDEGSKDGRFSILKPKRGRTIAHPERQEITAKLGETLRRTGINL